MDSGKTQSNTPIDNSATNNCGAVFLHTQPPNQCGAAAAAAQPPGTTNWPIVVTTKRSAIGIPMPNIKRRTGNEKRFNFEKRLKNLLLSKTT